MSALPIRYLGWMARDLARGHGLVMLGLAALAMVVEVGVNGAGVAPIHQVGVPLILLATAGMVSGDFRGGHHRTLFAKPVSPPLYYLLRWSVGAAAVLLAMLVVDAGVALRLHLPMTALGVLVRAGLLYLVLGSLVFLLSTLTRPTG